MGIDIIRLGNRQESLGQRFTQEDLGHATYNLFKIPDPPLSIWWMSTNVGQPLFPWWNYDAALDDDIHRLAQLWSITSSQTFFDCLFLSQLKRAAGQNFYVIFPGSIKGEIWSRL